MTSIIRVKHNRENPYLQVCRKTIRDINLDLQAKGFLVFLLDKPSDWKIRPLALAEELEIGETTVYRILNRLIAAGYVYRELIKRNKDGKFQTGAIYVVFEDKDSRQEWEDKSEFEKASSRRYDYSGIPF